MSKHKTRAAEVLAQLGVVSLEDNDLNINIQAEHEGDADQEEAADLGEFDNAPEAVEVEPVEEDALVADTSAAPETAELDVVEADASAAEVSGKMEEVGEAVDALESLAIQIATLSLEGRQISPATAGALNIQYDYITRNFPKMQRSSSRIASCEAYATDFEKAHTVSLESVMEKIKEGGKAVFKWFRDLGAKSTAFFGHALSASKVMGDKARALKSRLENVEEFKEVKVPGLLGEELSVQNVKTLATFLKAMANQDYKDLAAAVARGEETKENAQNMIIMSGGASKVIRNYKDKTLIGNITITGGEGSYFKCGLGNGKATKVTLDKNTAIGLADAVEDLASAIGDYKRTQAMRVATEKTIVAAENKLGEDQGKISKASKWLRGFGEVRAFERRILSRAIAVGNATNNVLSKSAKGKGKAADTSSDADLDS